MDPVRVFANLFVQSLKVLHQDGYQLMERGGRGSVRVYGCMNENSGGTGEVRVRSSLYSKGWVMYS